jgi:GNAT superfamily N-acetyltransferase
VSEGVSTLTTDIRYDVPSPASFERWPIPSRRLEVRWLRGWTPEADSALKSLPQMPNCPHDLFRKVMTNTEAGTKRCALVLKDRVPIALIGLRRRGRSRWQLITDREVSPRSWAPTAPGCLLSALSALQSDVEINEWYAPLPALARATTQYPLYRIDLGTDYKAFWRDSGQGFERRLRRAASRTRKFDFEVDTAGIAAWTIRTWSERWGEQIAASDLLMAADYYSACGRLHAFALIDNGVQCAGLTGFAAGDELILLTTARETAYEHHGVGTRIHELAIEWAGTNGFKTVTFGSGRVDSYKRWWALPSGVSWTFRVRPAVMDAVKRGKDALLIARGRATTVARSFAGAKSA